MKFHIDKILLTMIVANIIFTFSETRDYTMHYIKGNPSRWICEEVLHYTASENLVRGKKVPKWGEILNMTRKLVKKWEKKKCILDFHKLLVWLVTNWAFSKYKTDFICESFKIFGGEGRECKNIYILIHVTQQNRLLDLKGLKDTQYFPQTRSSLFIIYPWKLMRMART